MMNQRKAIVRDQEDDSNEQGVIDMIMMRKERLRIKLDNDEKRRKTQDKQEKIMQKICRTIYQRLSWGL